MFAFNDTLNRQLHQQFISSDLVFQDHPIPVFERYQWVMDTYPELCKKCLFEDMSDTYEHVMTHDAGIKVHAAYELALLQMDFWAHMQKLGRCEPHFAAYQHVTAHRFSERLADHVDVMKEWRRAGKNDQRIRKPKPRANPKRRANREEVH